MRRSAPQLTRQAIHGEPLLIGPKKGVIVKQHDSTRRKARPKKAQRVDFGCSTVHVDVWNAIACASTWSSDSGTAPTMMRRLRHCAKLARTLSTELL